MQDFSIMQIEMVDLKDKGQNYCCLKHFLIITDFIYFTGLNRC